MDTTGPIEDAVATDDSVDPPLVGTTIRRLRQRLGMSLQELAEASGVSVGMVSQIERDVANPSLRTLTRLRHALGVPLSALFEETAPARSDPDFVRRADRRPRLALGPGQVMKELLSSVAAQNLQFMILHVPPHGSSGDQPLSYPAEKAGLLLSGEVVLRVGDAEALLAEGDSFQFDSRLPHSFRNPAARPARLLWIIGQTLADRHL